MKRKTIRAAPWAARVIAVMALAAIVPGCAIVPAQGPAADPQAAPVAGRTAPFLSAAALFTGGRLVTGIDKTGAPAIQSGVQAYRSLVHPAAAAGREPDLYVADTGAGVIFRIDMALNVMAVFPGARAQIGTRLHLGGDFSLYVVDQAARRISRFGRNGQLLVTYSDGLDLGRPVDVAVDEARGRVLVADGLFNHLVAFHPLGRAAYVVPLRPNQDGRVLGIAAIAVGAAELYLADPVCGCIVRVAPDGAIIGRFGMQHLARPARIAVDRFERVYVVDAEGGALKVFFRENLVLTLLASDVGMLQFSDVSIAGDSVVLSDGPGARVQLMRIAPAAR